MQHHKYSLNEIDSLIPWEKEVYVSMLVDHIKEQEAKQTKQAEQVESLPACIQIYIKILKASSDSEETFLSKIYEGMLTERLEDNDEVWRNLTHQVDVTELSN